MNYSSFVKEAQENLYWSSQWSLSHQNIRELFAIIVGPSGNLESIEKLIQIGIKELAEMRVNEIMERASLSYHQATQVKAAIELGRRLSRGNIHDRVTIRSPKDVSDYMMDSLRYLHQEHFVSLFLNTKNQIIGQETIFVGTLNSSLVHPREVFRAAIRRSSASIVVAHNHPSGDPTPSKEDQDITKRLVECGHLVGIEVLDHIIIGDGAYFSLKERGLM
jgi:DNA repair protein RadC